jgi:cholesterol oxidase
MADTADGGVVNQYGEVFGHPGLFIADGSIVPSALGRNPAYTICALAERVAEHMLA